MAANENLPSDDPFNFGGKPDQGKSNDHKPPTDTPVPEDDDGGFFDFNAVAPVVEGASGKLNLDVLPDPGSSPSLISWAEVIRQQREQQADLGPPAAPFTVDSNSDKDLLDRIAAEEGSAGERDTDKLKRVPLVGEEGASRSGSSLQLGTHDPSQASTPSGSAVRFDITDPPADAAGAMPLPLDEGEVIEALPLEEAFDDIPLAEAISLDEVEPLPLDDDATIDILSLDEDDGLAVQTGKSSILDFLLNEESASAKQRSGQADVMVSGPGSGVLSGLAAKPADSGIDLSLEPDPPSIEPGNSWMHDNLSPLMSEAPPPLAEAAGDSAVLPDVGQPPVEAGDSWKAAAAPIEEAPIELPEPVASDSRVDLSSHDQIELAMPISAIDQAEALPPLPAVDLTDSVLSDPCIELPGIGTTDSLTVPAADRSWHALEDVIAAEAVPEAQPLITTGDSWTSAVAPAEPAPATGNDWKQTMASFQLPGEGSQEALDLGALPAEPIGTGDSWTTAASIPAAEPASAAPIEVGEESAWEMFLGDQPEVPSAPAAGPGRQTMASFQLPDEGSHAVVDLDAILEAEDALPVEALPVGTGDSWTAVAAVPPPEPASEPPIEVGKESAWEMFLDDQAAPPTPAAGHRVTMPSFELPAGSMGEVDLNDEELEPLVAEPIEEEALEPLPIDDIDTEEGWNATPPAEAAQPGGWGQEGQRQKQQSFQLPDENAEDAVDIYGEGALHQGITESGSLRISDEEMEEAARKLRHAESSAINLGSDPSSPSMFSFGPPSTTSDKSIEPDDTIDMSLPDTGDDEGSMVRKFEDIAAEDPLTFNQFAPAAEVEELPEDVEEMEIAEAIEDEDEPVPAPVAKSRQVKPESVPDISTLFGEEPAAGEAIAEPIAGEAWSGEATVETPIPTDDWMNAATAEATAGDDWMNAATAEAVAEDPAFTAPPPPAAEKPGRRGKKDKKKTPEPVEAIAPVAGLADVDAEAVVVEDEAIATPAKKKGPKPERPAKKGGGMLAGTAVGLLLGAGGLFAAYYFEAMPSPKALIDGTEETPKVVNNQPKPPVVVNDENVNPRPAEPVATPQSARQFIDAGEPAKALAAYDKLPNKDDAAVRAGMGQAQWLAYLQAQAADGKEPNRDDEKVKTALDHLKAAADAAKADEKLEAEALRAYIWQAAIEESLDDFDAAQKVYDEAEAALKSPASKAAIKAAKDRLKVIGPEPKSPTTAIPAEHLLLAFTLLLADPPGTPSADEPAGQEAGFLFWEAMVAARENRFADAIKLIPQIKAVHARQRVKMAGKGLNPLSDPREQMVPAALDDLARYWALCDELYKRPEAKMLVEQRKVPEALAEVFMKSKANDDAMKLIVDKLMPKADEKPVEAIDALITGKKKAEDDKKTADDLRKAAEDMLAAVGKSLKDAGIDEPKVEDALKKLVAGKEDAEGKIKSLGEAFDKAGVKEPDTAKALAMLVTARDDADAIVKTVRERFEKAKYVEPNASRDALLKAVDEAITRGAADALVKLSEEKKVAEAKAAKLEAEADKVKKDAEAAATKAKEDADAAVKKAQADAEATAAKAKKDLADLKAMYEGILQNAGKEFAAHAAKSDELLKAGKYDAALREYIAGIKTLKVLPPENETGLERILTAHPAMQKANVSDGDPSLALKFYNEGLEQFRDGRYDRAEREFASAVQFDNKDARYRYFLGMARWLQNKTDVAAKDFEAAAQLEAIGRPNVRVVNAALQSVQGPLRAAVEKYRP